MPGRSFHRLLLESVVWGFLMLADTSRVSRRCAGIKRIRVSMIRQVRSGVGGGSSACSLRQEELGVGLEHDENKRCRPVLILHGGAHFPEA